MKIDLNKAVTNVRENVREKVGTVREKVSSVSSKDNGERHRD